MVHRAKLGEGAMICKQNKSLSSLPLLFPHENGM